MKHEFDMTGAKKLGTLEQGNDSTVRSICWACKRPVSECEWLMLGKPYKGSKYWERKCWYDGHTHYCVYAIVKCPKYKQN